MSLDNLARLIIFMGIALVIIGIIVLLISRLGFPLGQLPGDFRIERENFTCIFPLASMILISVLLTVILNLIIRLLNR